MEPVIDTIVHFSSFMVPALALWAIAALYMQRSDVECALTQLFYFGTLLLISFVTLRTITSNDGCWLVHTATLGITIVAGAMRRPVSAAPGYVPDFK